MAPTRHGAVIDSGCESSVARIVCAQTRQAPHSEWTQAIRGDVVGRPVVVIDLYSDNRRATFVEDRDRPAGRAPGSAATVAFGSHSLEILSGKSTLCTVIERVGEAGCAQFPPLERRGRGGTPCVRNPIVNRTCQFTHRRS
jgi:hypothetical protein